MSPFFVVFGDAELAVDLVLLFCKHEQHDHEHDQRTLCGHVEAERKAEHRNNDLVKRNDKHVDDVAEEKPHTEMHPHQAASLLPMRFVVL